MRGFVTSVATTCLLLGAGTAHAEATGWTHVSGGAMGWQMGPDASLTASPIMTIDAGVGTDPDAPFIFGGLFRVQPVFGEGVDLALYARAATEGFQKDWFGFALDLGAYQRWWGIESTGFSGQLTLGGPFGLQLAALGTAGSNDAFGFGGTLGIDLARLTVFRGHLKGWWPNPDPTDRDTASR